MLRIRACSALQPLIAVLVAFHRNSWVGHHLESVLSLYINSSIAPFLFLDRHKTKPRSHDFINSRIAMAVSKYQSMRHGTQTDVPPYPSFFILLLDISRDFLNCDALATQEYDARYSSMERVLVGNTVASTCFSAVILMLSRNVTWVVLCFMIVWLT